MARRTGISLVAAIIASLAATSAVAADPGAPDSASPTEVVAGLLLQLESNLKVVDATIARHELRLDELYELRDAADDDPDRIALYDGMIDRLTLLLDETERLRADLAANVEAARGSLSALELRQVSGESQ